MRTVEAQGFTWTAREGADDFLAWGGHEVGLIRLAEGLLPEGGVFVDVGAHCGAYALRLSTKASFVVAIEACGDTFEGLVLNAALNVGRGGEKVFCLPFAAWDAEATLFASSEAVMDNHRQIRERHVADGSTHLVTAESWRDPKVDSSVAPIQAYPLDFLLDKLARVDLIKIDVEGAEGRVLLGAEAVVARHRPVLLIEMHDPLLEPAEALLLTATVTDFLDRHRYVKSDPMPAGAGYHLICQPEERLP